MTTEYTHEQKAAMLAEAMRRILYTAQVEKIRLIVRTGTGEVDLGDCIEVVPIRGLLPPDDSGWPMSTVKEWLE